MSDRQPTEIGKYHIVEVVGEGAMGIVYRATDSVLDRTVAIKVMSASIARQEDLRKRFLREAQAAGSLQHPNVVTIYDLGEVEGHLFIAMEFVYGTDLEQMLSLSEPMKLQTKLDIIVDVLTGLAYAHRKGIVHRDIKPANIRVGEDGRAKIMDFGVAHLGSSNITRTGLVVGTPSYMAPEQVMGQKALPETDIFAVGAVLYQLLTGVKPFESPTLQSLFYKIVTDMPKSVSELMPGLPPALDRITMKALAKDAANRYNNALDMANEISAVRSELSGAPYPRTLSLANTTDQSVVDDRVPAPALTKGGSTEVIKPQQKFPLWAIGAGVAALALIGWVVFGRKHEPATTAQTAAAVSAPTTAGSAKTEVASTTPASVAPAESAPPPPPAAVEKVAELPKATKAKPVTPAPRKIVQEAPRTRTVVAEKVAAAKPAPASAPVVSAPAPTLPAQPPVTAPAMREGVPKPPAVVNVVTAPPAEKPRVPSVEVGNAVAAYARAIESRDISAVRRAYPGLTSDQARGFEQFFDSARNINVTFRVAGLDVNGNSADARLVGSYQYTSGSRTETQPVSFAATLRYDGSSWKLMSVR
jgi:serine/threonine-protein kinase